MITSVLALAFATLPLAHGPTYGVDTRAMLRPVAHLAGDKNPRKWIEKVQEVQYDGEYSPPSGRMAEPEPSATVPVRYLPKYVREIPVIVKPAPVYVDEATIAQQNQERAQAQQQAQQVPGQQFGGQGGAYGAGPVPLTSGAVVPGPLPSSGSATGSTAIATYGALPNATVVPAQGEAEKDD
jgi:hypothetical protein